MRMIEEPLMTEQVVQIKDHAGVVWEEYTIVRKMFHEGESFAEYNVRLDSNYKFEFDMLTVNSELNTQLSNTEHRRRHLYIQGVDA